MLSLSRFCALDRARKGRLLLGPRVPQVFLACLGPLALEDLVLLGHQDPQGHQDPRPSSEQVSTVSGVLVCAAVVLRVTSSGGMSATVTKGCFLDEASSLSVLKN